MHNKNHIKHHRHCNFSLEMNRKKTWKTIT